MLSGVNGNQYIPVQNNQNVVKTKSHLISKFTEKEAVYVDLNIHRDGQDVFQKGEFIIPKSSLKEVACNLGAFGRLAPNVLGAMVNQLVFSFVSQAIGSLVENHMRSSSGIPDADSEYGYDARMADGLGQFAGFLAGTAAKHILEGVWKGVQCGLEKVYPGCSRHLNFEIGIQGNCARYTNDLLSGMSDIAMEYVALACVNGLEAGLPKEQTNNPTRSAFAISYACQLMSMAFKTAVMLCCFNKASDKGNVRLEKLVGGKDNSEKISSLSDGHMTTNEIDIFSGKEKVTVPRSKLTECFPESVINLVTNVAGFGAGLILTIPYKSAKTAVSYVRGAVAGVVSTGAKLLWSCFVTNRQSDRSSSTTNNNPQNVVNSGNNINTNVINVKPRNAP